MFHPAAHKDTRHPAAQVAHPPVKVTSRVLPELPSGNVRRLSPATRARIILSHPENSPERLAARSCMTDAFRHEVVCGDWIDDAYCLDAPQDMPGGGHWQGGRRKRTWAGNFYKGRVYAIEATRDGWVSPYAA